MSNKIFNRIKNIGLYFSASFIPMLLNLAINPFVAMHMSPTDYAITGYYTSFSTLIAPMITFYMLHYYTKRFFEVSELERERLKSTILKSLIFFSIIITILCFLGLLIYICLFNQNSKIPIMPYIFLSVFALPLTGAYSLMLVDLRMSRKSEKFFQVSTINGVLLVVLTLFFVIIFKWGAIGKLLAPFCTNLIFFLWTCYEYKDLFHYKFDKKQFRRIIKFCTTLTLEEMLGFFSNGYDRIFLERLGDTQELGFYVVGVQIAGYILVFQNAIGATFQPDLFQSIAQRDYKKMIKISALLIGSTAIIVLIFILFSPLIIKILTAGRYMLSLKYTQIIALSTITSAIYYTISQITVALGRSYITLFNKIITSVLSILCFSILINEYQFIGAAWGLVLSFIISALGNLALLLIFKKKPTNVIKNTSN